MALHRRAFLAATAGAIVGSVLPATAASAQEIGQMLMLGFAGGDASSASAKALAAQIDAGHVGGVVFLGYNVKSRKDILGLTSMFREAAGRRSLFLAIDQEGGAVQRLGKRLGYASVPTARAVAAGYSTDQARTLYAKMARDLVNSGFNLNLAPVVDLEIEPKSPIIAKYGRGFGKDATTVSAYASAFVDGHRDAGVACVLKHFPGHGSTRVDSHKGVVDITKTWRPEEVEAFATMVGTGHADMIMTGHLSRADLGGMPATLSRVVVQRLIRRELGFNGPVITDDLDMAAIRSRFPLLEATVRAIAAGADMVMLSNSLEPDPKLPEKVIAAVNAAIETGTISASEITRSVARLARLHARAG